MALLKKSVGILLPSIRISFALVMLTICLMLFAEFLDFLPNESKYQLAARKQISEALAVQFSIVAAEQEPKNIQKILSTIAKRNPEIETIGIRLANHQLVFQIGDHVNQWGDYADSKSSTTHLVVPIMQNGEPWGTIEIVFKPIPGQSGFDFYRQPIFKLAGFVLVFGFFSYLVFMLRTLKILDPSAVIPGRVNAAFDTLIEGIIILDEYGQIVLANKAFTEKLAIPLNSIIGKRMSTLKWQNQGQDINEKNYPWDNVLRSGKSTIGVQLTLLNAENNVVKFVINASPILSGKSVIQGVLITLDDITELEERNTALQSLVSQLEETQAFVQQQNRELNYLATRDSLTGCLNRRAFSEAFERAFKEAKQSGQELSCFMADIDHFKAVNDNYGHSVGDVVIKLFAEILQSNTRKVDLVGRYGGEEFCVVLPGLSADEVITVAERIRIRLKDESAHRFETGPRVTSSFGVSSLKDNPSSPSEMNTLADEALYVAKESGRNRVMRWQAKTELELAEQKIKQTAVKKSTRPEQKDINSETLAKLQSRVNELESIASKFSAELEFSKHYDALTGLPNQTLFNDRIAQVIERGSRFDLIAAILVIDIGMLGQINTTLGRAAGDNLLTQIAERLKSTFRKYDAISRLTISRFGGDQFAILLADLNSKEVVTWIVTRLQDSLSEALDIDGNSIFVSSHVGISLYPLDAQSVDDLINNAIFAKNYSKQMHAENDYQFFDEHMQKLSIKHVTLEKEIRQAIQNQEWVLLYQPKLDCKTKSIFGVEALIRWKHPVKGMVAPYEFIDFAEQRGLIVAIGDWVIKTACHQLKAWQEAGINNCKIAVNLSAFQLKQPDFVAKIFQTLAETGVPPRMLELELTESILINNFDVALNSLKRLNSRGISISIDDFGTGYSSLGYLKNLPINTVKIDRTFIKDILSDDRDKQIVKAMISMAHSMGMSVIAEGVEERKQFDFLLDQACDGIQGYLLSKPVPIEQLNELLTKPQHLTE